MMTKKEEERVGGEGNEEEVYTPDTAGVVVAALTLLSEEVGRSGERTTLLMSGPGEPQRADSG